ncbi:hypothetical protein PVAND_001794 [Polypedilum vanderplanki]|uniref:Uncharacterized protein n=1 Tax=Polypedilum vanderplanki TaxID=319348 RepID=A0A9J6BP06_POLVA|nr:hypothetical protein PVAND_001794 [Polypedilum vanderplanki]
METRSRTTKLIVKNVEMLENQKFDKFDKVVQWLDKLDTFEIHQHQKNPPSETSTNQQNSSSIGNKNGEYLDSDSSINTARYILSNRKNKRKSSTQCRSKIKKYRESDVQFEYDLDDLNNGHKLKRLKIDPKPNLKYCGMTVQKINMNEINYTGT